jgi:nicotinate-nucleotide--dimethylbenzimidazole phosphoribosyltransferase
MRQVDRTFEQELIEKINFKTKPLGALGLLEQLALQIGRVQQSLSPVLHKPTIIVFAGDHGIAAEGVSAYPPEVTHQMVMNFLRGGAAVNVFCRQHHITLKVVDAGVNFTFEPHTQLVNAKIAHGTQSFLHQKAMTEAQLEKCFDWGAQLVADVAKTGCNVIGFGEMGIGNTSAASLIMSYLCTLPIEECVGRGTGLNDAQLEKKRSILRQAQGFHGPLASAEAVLQAVGGFEIAQMCGAMRAAYAQNMLILVDGFIATTAFLAACQINPKIRNNAIFCHQSDESGHRQLLNYLNAKPILNLQMRLGEGTGCAVAFPIIQSAVAFLNDMASFESANVSTNP